MYNLKRRLYLYHPKELSYRLSVFSYKYKNCLRPHFGSQYRNLTRHLCSDEKQVLIAQSAWDRHGLYHFWGSYHSLQFSTGTKWKGLIMANRKYWLFCPVLLPSLDACTLLQQQLQVLEVINNEPALSLQRFLLLFTLGLQWVSWDSHIFTEVCSSLPLCIQFWHFSVCGRHVSSATACQSLWQAKTRCGWTALNAVPSSTCVSCFMRSGMYAWNTGILHSRHMSLNA